jgi:putative membrane protein
MNLGIIEIIVLMVLWAVLISLAVLIVMALFGNLSRRQKGLPKNTREILDQRYVRGELTREQYEQLRQSLEKEGKMDTTRLISTLVIWGATAGMFLLGLMQGTYEGWGGALVVISGAGLLFLGAAFATRWVWSSGRRADGTAGPGADQRDR